MKKVTFLSFKVSIGLTEVINEFFSTLEMMNSVLIDHYSSPIKPRSALSNVDQSLLNDHPWLESLFWLFLKTRVKFLAR